MPLRQGRDQKSGVHDIDVVVVRVKRKTSRSGEDRDRETRREQLLCIHSENILTKYVRKRDQEKKNECPKLFLFEYLTVRRVALGHTIQSLLVRRERHYRDQHRRLQLQEI